MNGSAQAGDGFARLVGILAALRGENGCPWDKEQDAASILNYFLEEVYEAAEALEDGSTGALCEELGDVLMEVVFLCRIYEERGAFTAADALQSINDKMVSRHPHVFGDKKFETSSRVVEEWQKSKLKEKKRASLFEGVPRRLPALLAAFQIGQRAASVGFDWPDAREALAKVKEEVAELEEAMDGGDRGEAGHELGDLFFALANVARKLQVNPELALLKANEKFIGRFGLMEAKLKSRGLPWGTATLEQMDQAWNEVKREEESGG